MEKQSSPWSTVLTLLIIVVVVAGGFYWWQSTQPAEVEPVVEEPVVEEPEEEPSPQFDTMAEYVEFAIDQSPVEEPSGLVRVEFGGIPVDVKLEGASVPMYVYAEPDWDQGGDLEAVLMFYLKSESPAFILEDPEAEKQEFWNGPFYGKLLRLVE